VEKRDGVRIGIYLGGTKIEGVVLSGPKSDPEVLLNQRIPTEVEGGRAHITARVVRFIQNMVQDCGLTFPVPIGIGMPGRVTPGGVVRGSNAVCLNDTPFHEDVANQLGQPVAFANDANCFALAEALMGTGKGYPFVFGVVMGTGVGGGLVIDGKVREGLMKISGEWGHTILEPTSERVCHCGKKGCVETYLAGPHIEKHYTELSGDSVRLPEIITRWEAGEEAAKECVQVWLDHYGIAMANLINTLDPDIIVLGGGVSRSDVLYGAGRAYIEKHVFAEELLTPVVRHSFGDSAGVFGAAFLV
jgi:predicted NBD/HSP70 family sugar kinase